MPDPSRVILVAGARGALGSAVVRAFLAAGDTVGALARPEKASAASSDDDPLPASPALIRLDADAADTDEVTRAVTTLLQHSGRIDALVNAIGGYTGGAVLETADVAWHRALELNLLTAVRLARAVLPHMGANHSGRIIQVAGRAPLKPFPGAAAYITSKTALLGFMRVLALEVARMGITACSVLPGTIDTPANRRDMPKADRSTWVPPDDLARIIVGLCAPEARHLNGAEITVG